MLTQLDLFSWRARKRGQKPKGLREWKIVAVRETAPDSLPYCIHPEDAVRYWRENIATAPHFNPEVECFAVILVNIKRRIRGHHIVSIGGLNETVAHPREVFRAAVIGAAWGVVLAHNHPSGDPTPSDADRRTTTRLVEAGRILQIEVVDHVIVGNPNHCSFVAAGLM
jgi:DNA repair protein RadC